VYIPRLGNSIIAKKKSKAPMLLTPSYKRPRGSIGHNNHVGCGNFGKNGSKGASGNKVSWGNPKDAKGANIFKVHLSLTV